MMKNLFNLFSLKKKQSKEISSEEINQSDVYKQLMQEHADHEYERNAKAEGLDMFEQMLSGQIILISKPRQIFHMIYTKSKWETGDYDKIKQQEFKRLKFEYHERNLGTDAGR